MNMTQTIKEEKEKTIELNSYLYSKVFKWFFDNRPFPMSPHEADVAALKFIKEVLTN